MPKGLKAEIVLWHLDKRSDEFTSRHARLWIRGDVTKVDGLKRERKKFNDAGQLIAILGKWNAEKLREFRHKKKKSN
jgi:hypothetical protein